MICEEVAFWGRKKSDAIFLIELICVIGRINLSGFRLHFRRIYASGFVSGSLLSLSWALQRRGGKVLLPRETGGQDWRTFWGGVGSCLVSPFLARLLHLFALTKECWTEVFWFYVYKRMVPLASH
jgi:hypothetical protein